MRKDRFYLPDIEKQSRVIDSEAVHKIKNVLRKKEGDFIYGFNGRGKEYLLKVVKIERKCIALKIDKITEEQKRGKVKIVLFFSLLKSRNTDLAFQKGTEVGVDEFVPFVSFRTEVKSPGDKKLKHWKKVILQAAAQSQRLFLPELRDTVKLDDISKNSFKEDELCLVAEPSGNSLVSGVLSTVEKDQITRVYLVVGPEGGFSPDELNRFKKQDRINLVKISGSILRAETACIVLPYLVKHYLRTSDE